MTSPATRTLPRRAEASDPVPGGSIPHPLSQLTKLWKDCFLVEMNYEKIAQITPGNIEREKIHKYVVEIICPLTQWT